MSAPSIPFLTEREAVRLNLFKWLYQIRAHGFSAQEAGRILWLKYLVETGQLTGDTARAT